MAVTDEIRFLTKNRTVGSRQDVTVLFINKIGKTPGIILGKEANSEELVRITHSADLQEVSRNHGKKGFEHFDQTSLSELFSVGYVMPETYANVITESISTCWELHKP